MHGRKSVLSIGMARGEFGELTRGEVTRFHCIALFTLLQQNIYAHITEHIKYKFGKKRPGPDYPMCSVHVHMRPHHIEGPTSRQM